MKMTTKNKHRLNISLIGGFIGFCFGLILLILFIFLTNQSEIINTLLFFGGITIPLSEFVAKIICFGDCAGDSGLGLWGVLVSFFGIIFYALIGGILGYIVSLFVKTPTTKKKYHFSITKWWSGTSKITKVSIIAILVTVIFLSQGAMLFLLAPFIIIGIIMWTIERRKNKGAKRK